MRYVISVCGNGLVLLSEECQISRSVDGSREGRVPSLPSFSSVQVLFAPGWTGPGMPSADVSSMSVSSSNRRAQRSRVGKGRPAGSMELRVSPSPSKIPYGGFSPVRLQMDRQWRPSTTSQGLSAVHIHPLMPSYTPPQFVLPEVRDPRRDLPVLEPRGSIWHDSQQRQHVHPEALGSPAGYVVPSGHRLLRPHPPL